MDISDFELDEIFNRSRSLSEILDLTNATAQSLLDEIISASVNLYYNFEFSTSRENRIFIISLSNSRIDKNRFLNDEKIDLFFHKDVFPEKYWKPILRKYGPANKIQFDGKTSSFQLERKKTVPLSDVLIFPRYFNILIKRFKKHGFEIDIKKKTIRMSGQEISLSTKQIKLLQIMVRLTKTQATFTPHDLSAQAGSLFNSESQKLTDIFPKNTKNGAFINSNILIKVSRGQYRISLYN